MRKKIRKEIKTPVIGEYKEIINGKEVTVKVYAGFGHPDFRMDDEDYDRVENKS